MRGFENLTVGEFEVSNLWVVFVEVEVIGPAADQVASHLSSSTRASEDVV